MRAFLIGIFVSLNVFAAFGQISMKNVISKAPASVFPYLSKNQFDELIHDAEIRMEDNNRSDTAQDSVLSVKNNLEGKTYVDSLSADFIRIHLNNSTEVQIRLLDRTDSSTILCFLKTTKFPIVETSVILYGLDWTPLNDRLGLPDIRNAKCLLNDFVQRPDSMSLDEYVMLCSYIEPVVIAADFASNENAIIFTLSMPFVPKDKSEMISRIFKKNIFKWNGHAFIKC